MLTQKNKLAHIEGIRGLAAIIVVLHHYTLAFYPALNFGDINQAHIGDGIFELVMSRTPLNLIYNGGFAVCIFFILSGYVLSNSYHKTNDPKILIQYSVKRYFRLLIPVGASIILAYSFMKAGFMNNANLGAITKTNDWLSGSFDRSGDLFDVIKNMFVDVFFFKDNKYNPVLWTMTYELLGSFLIFSFLLITHPVKYKIGLYLALIIALFITDNNFYAAFILGVMLNKLQLSSIAAPFPKWLSGLLLSTGLFFCSYPICINIDHTIYNFITFSFLNNYEFYHVIGSFMVMLAILQSARLKEVLSSKTFSYTGKISFSFYLLHFIILCSLTCYLFTLFYPACNYNLSVLLSFTCSLPVIVLSAIVYYKWIDKAGIMLSEKVLRLFVTKTVRS